MTRVLIGEVKITFGRGFAEELSGEIKGGIFFFYKQL